MSVNYETVQGPNYAAYANPNFGAQLGQMLQGLPASYMEGRQIGQQRQMEDMFKTEKLPRNSDGSVDVNNLIERGTKIGGFPFVMKMLPFLQSEELMKQAGRSPSPTLGVGGDQGSSAPAASAAGPGNLGQQPRTSSNGSDVDAGPGAGTLRSTVTEFVGGDTDATPQISAAARALRIDPDAPLTPDKAKLVKDFLSTSRNATSSLSNQETQPPGQPSSAAERNSNGPGGANAAPFMAGGVSGAPAPSQGNGRPPQPAQAQLGQQPGTPPQRVAQATEPGTGLPPGYTLENAQKYEDSARRKSQFSLAADRSGNQAMAKSFQDQSAQDAATAKAIREKIAENAALSPEAKKARESGVPGGPAGLTKQEEITKKEIDLSKTKTEPAIQAMSEAGFKGNERLDLIKRTMSDPNFFSGAGSDIMKKWNQWTVSLGGNPDTARPMETFHKTVYDMLSEQIRAMAQSGYSRIQLAEIKNMQNSIASLGISPAANRYLVEELTRVHNQNIKLGQLSQQYVKEHGYLDNGWNEVRDRFFQDPRNQLFDKKELDDPRLIAPPYLPAGIASDPAKKAQWTRNQGLKPGDPFVADGPDSKQPAGPNNTRHLRAW